MLAIKLRPVGKKKQISYRVVVMEKKSKLKGKFIEDLGWYNPHTNASSLKAERVQYWLKSGAQPTDTVHNVLIKAQVQEGSKVPKHKKVEKKAEEQPQSSPVAVAPAGAQNSESATANQEAVAAEPAEEVKQAAEPEAVPEAHPVTKEVPSEAAEEPKTEA
jgi:small subunit ribosomal protein S16